MKHLKNVLIIFVVSIIITFIFDFTLSSDSPNIKGILLNILYGVTIGGTLSLTGFITRLIIKKIGFGDNPIKTYVILLILVFLYITIDVLAINLTWFSITQDYKIIDIITNTGFILTNLLTIFIGIIIFFIILSKSYITQLIKKEKDEQKAKNEVIKFQYKALQSQVNPHFLFNSLNTLSSMISIEPEKAEDFVNHLSKLYRYILENKDSELININDEILFIDNYIVLQKYRFSNNIIFEIDESVKNINGKIVPMSLQLLVENAIKHNIISEENKLKINITKDDENYICIINNINIKESGNDSFNIGIENIEKRYSYVSDKKCIFENNGKEYKVKIPIINI
jgi:sensor histidine kinase YesM